METVQYADSERKARKAREQALTDRPQDAPLPGSLTGSLDNEPYRQAALQYFEAAQRFYQAGDHGRGDYCILRGDTYLLLTFLATQVNSIGVVPVLNEKPAEHVAEAGAYTEKEREAKLQRLQEALDRKGRSVPLVPTEVANSSSCDYFHEQSLAAVGQAIDASDAGNDAGVDYWLHESLL